MRVPAVRGISFAEFYLTDSVLFFHLKGSMSSFLIREKKLSSKRIHHAHDANGNVLCIKSTVGKTEAFAKQLYTADFRVHGKVRIDLSAWKWLALKIPTNNIGTHRVRKHVTSVDCGEILPKECGDVVVHKSWPISEYWRSLK